MNNSITFLLLALALSIACGGGGGGSSDASSSLFPDSDSSDSTVLSSSGISSGQGGDENDYLFIDVANTDSSGNFLVTTGSNLEIFESSINNVYMTNIIVLKKVLAAGNSFTMGSSDVNFSKSDQTEHRVTFSSNFYMGVFEVTQRQYAYVMGVNPARWKHQIKPIETVSYEDLRGDNDTYEWPETDEVDPESFIGILREKTNLRLDMPTEAEWEFVCKAGTGDLVGSDNMLYNTLTHSGNTEIFDEDDLIADLSELGFFFDNNQREFDIYQTTFVGALNPNAWGFYDMHGNVWEWCKDYYVEDLGTSLVDDPEGANTGTNRTVRGGYYAGDADDNTSATREGFIPSNQAEIVGLRLYIKGDLN